MGKVYCRYCKYLEDTCWDGGGMLCRKEITVDTPLSPYRKIIWHIDKQNKNNDCQYYEYKKYQGLDLTIK